MKSMARYMLITLGWVCVFLGLLGVPLPLLPTTPFLLLALFFFAKSSPRFHAMLLNNHWFGPALQQWEQDKTIDRKVKHKAMVVVMVTFSISMILVRAEPIVQGLLAVIGGVLLIFLSRLKESPA